VLNHVSKELPLVDKNHVGTVQLFRVVIAIVAMQYFVNGRAANTRYHFHVVRCQHRV
jgi:hypothetical protein